MAAVTARRFALTLVAACFLLACTDAQAVKFDVAVAGRQAQAYEIAPDAGANCQRYGTGGQVVEFITEKARVDVVKEKGGYRLIRGGRRVHAVELPILEASVSRIDQTQRTNSECDHDERFYPPPPVPLPQKDCTTDIESGATSIENTMDSFDFFLEGRRPDLEGGYFWLYEQGDDVIYGDPYDNCLAFAYDGGFRTAGDGFFDAARPPRLPANLLSRRGPQWFETKATGTFTKDLQPTGIGLYSYDGELYDDYRVGSSVVVRETVVWKLYMKRVGGRNTRP